MKATIEVRNQLFHVRVSTADDLIGEPTDAYDRLPDDLQAELPLKGCGPWVADDTSEA